MIEVIREVVETVGEKVKTSTEYSILNGIKAESNLEEIPDQVLKFEYIKIHGFDMELDPELADNFLIQFAQVVEKFNKLQAEIVEAAQPELKRRQDELLSKMKSINERWRQKRENKSLEDEAWALANDLQENFDHKKLEEFVQKQRERLANQNQNQ